MATIQGLCDPRFEKLKELMQQKLDSGEELGASIAVNLDGKTVVDMYGGFFDEAKTQPWKEDTIVNVWSSTKTVTALAVLILHDRGLLNVDDNVSKYWPEFAANGKENVKICHFLSHTSGVSGWEEPLTVEELYDNKIATERLAAQAPWWEPGTASGYHSITMGTLLGEIVRRVTGKPLKQFVADEISGPLGADFQIGAKESDWHRITNIIPPPHMDMSGLDPKSIMAKTFFNPIVDLKCLTTPAWRNAEIGASNGHTNARALCQILSAISTGGTVNGHKLLSQKTIDRIFEPQSDGTDLVLGAPIRFGIGYALSGGSTDKAPTSLPKGDNHRICFWGGWGGSWEIMDLDKRLTIAYTMNKMENGMVGTEKTWAYFAEVYKALE